MIRLLLSALLAATISFAAGLAGKWDVHSHTKSGEDYHLQIVFTEIDGQLTGTISGERGDAPIDSVHLEGDQLTFRITTEEANYSARFTVSGDTLEGTWTSSDGSSGTARATRRP